MAAPPALRVRSEPAPPSRTPAVAPPVRAPRPLANVQAKLEVSAVSDPAEREADHLARTVMRMPEPGTAPTLPARAAPRMAIQRRATGPAQADPDVESAIRAQTGGGAPLPPKVLRFMEPRFRANFGGVRIHTDAQAGALAARLSARAFTFGSHVFFARGAWQPDSPAGAELIAHELTHTIQQRAAVQREVVQREAGPVVIQQARPQVQRFGIDTVLDYIADKANIIPGFRMFTIVLGVNPINMSAVDASPANILRAVIEFIPGGGLVTQALDNSGVFEKVANWAAGQLKTLGMAGASIKKALMDFLNSLGLRDLASPGSVWDRAKAMFTGPIDQIKNFVKGFVTDIVQFVKDAILKPIAKLAEGTPSYDLLKGVMGKDPITGEPVADSADLMIGGFMTLIGQADVWENMKKSGAVPKAWAWFKGALADLKAFVLQIPPTFVAAFKSLELVDIVLVPRAFAKLAGVFGSFLGRFVSWAGTAVWNLLEIIFSVVKPGALAYVKRTGAALKSILKNPMPFVGNLVKAAKLGFQNFAGRFGTHLKNGLIDWLTGSLDGVYIPRALELGEIVKFVFSVLGLTWTNLRGKLVKAIGEPAVVALEKGFQIVKTLVTKGPAAAWEQIKSELSTLKDQVVGGIKDMVIEAVVTKAIPKLIAMFIPGAGFISAIISIYDTVMVFVQKIAKIIQVVTAFIDSIVAIAGGAIGAAAAKVESILAGLLSLAINFLAGFAGLGKIASKINGIIQKIRAPIDKALDKMVEWIRKIGKSIIDKLTGKDDTPEQKQKRLDQAAAAALSAVSKYSGKVVGAVILKPLLFVIKLRYRLTSLEPVKDGDVWAIRAEINPVKTVKTSIKAGKNEAEMEIGYEPAWPLDEFQSKAGAIKRAAEGKTQNQAITLGFEQGSTTQRKSTKELRVGGQDAFRSEIHAYIDQIPVKADQSSARALMTQLQADHQQELQMGGTDTAENMAMIESRMNSQMGAMWRGQLKDLPAETKIVKVKVETKTGTAKGQGHRASGRAAELQALLLVHAKALNTQASVIRNWFKL